MRKILAFVMMSLSFFCMHIHATMEGSYLVPLLQEDYEDCGDDEFNDLPPQHRRTPPVKETCTLDFSRQQILTTVSDVIISYEVWTEDGILQMGAFDNDADVVMFLNGIFGFYQIRLLTEEHIFVGYVEL